MLPFKGHAFGICNGKSKNMIEYTRNTTNSIKQKESRMTIYRSLVQHSCNVRKLSLLDRAGFPLKIFVYYCCKLYLLVIRYFINEIEALCNVCIMVMNVW